MIDKASLFPHRVLPLGDALSGLRRGLTNLPSLVALSLAPALAYAALMATVDTAAALYAPSYRHAWARSPLEWWASSLILAPFSTVITYGMLRHIWFGVRTEPSGFSRIPVAMFGLGIAWVAAAWLVARLGVSLNEWTMASYAGRFEHPSLLTDIANIQIFETFLQLCVGAGIMALITAAALSATRELSSQRAAIIGLAAATSAVVLFAVILKHGQFLLPDHEAQPDAEIVTNGILLIMLVAVVRASTHPWFKPFGTRMFQAGWRLALLFFIAAALAQATCLLFDVVAEFAGVYDVRIDDANVRSEFALRAFARHASIAIREILFCLVFACISAEGFRRILGEYLCRYDADADEPSALSQPST